MRCLIVPFCLLAAAGAAVAEDCDYSKPIRAQLDVGAATLLDLHAEAGSLVIEGAPGASSVLVEGTACASRESLLEEIRLETDDRGDRLVVEVDIPESDWSWRNYARLDLTVTVPTDLALRVEDGSGSIEIADVASLELEDGSGEIEVADVAGAVDIRDGSGEIDLRRIEGLVHLSDGSGSIRVEGARGGVRIDEDGSGEIRIVDVTGDVEIDSDGSGGITIEDVFGTVRVGSDGSGSIWVARIDGDFELRSDGSGSVHVDEVRGSVSLP